MANELPGPLERMVNRAATKVLMRGRRFKDFDQLRQRHFWSSILFAPGAGNVIPARPYDVFRIEASALGQGYPVPLTERETNWRGTGRVPDNQNFVIHEVGVTVKPLPTLDNSTPANAPSDSIYSNLPAAIQLLVDPGRLIHPEDSANILYGLVLEMGYLTNNVPLGLAADFSQNAGVNAVQSDGFAGAYAAGASPAQPNYGDMTNGVAAPAFRRKLEIPILLQHGEAMGMRLNAHVDIPTLSLANGGTGAFEVRVDWWASESFVEFS